MSAALVACSSNTQSQNTAVGAVTGGVVGGVAGSAIGQGVGHAVAIGTGAIVGVIIGGMIGQSMDSTDKTHTYQTMNTGEMNRADTWTNPNTGTTYTIMPTSRVMTYGDYKYCRKYHSVAHINGKKHKSRGIACKNEDGTWVTVK